MVTRRSSARDQRRREVSLTPEGQALLKKLWPSIARGYDRLTDGIAREEIALCASVLSRMIDNVRKHDI